MNLPAILNNANWIDFIYAVLFLGMVYKGARTGVGGQIVSVAGWIFLLFSTIRYYEWVSEALFGFLLQSWAKPLSFFVIGALIFAATKLLERIFSVMVGAELSALERAGGAIVAALRSFIFFGLIGIFLLLIPMGQIRSSVIEGSKTSMFFVNMDASVYNAIARFMGVEGVQKNKDDVVAAILSVTEPAKK